MLISEEGYNFHTKQCMYHKSLHPKRQRSSVVKPVWLLKVWSKAVCSEVYFPLGGKRGKYWKYAKQKLLNSPWMKCLSAIPPPAPLLSFWEKKWWLLLLGFLRTVILHYLTVSNGHIFCLMQSKLNLSSWFYL